MVKCLPGNNRKVTPDKKMFFFFLIFETTSKFPIVFVRLILEKVDIDRVTRSRREIDVRYEFDLKIIFKGLRWK